MIERLRRNDRKAYSDLFDRYFDKLFTFALNMVFREDVANDIVQEVFIAIYEKSVLKNYQGSLKAYLYTSVRNRCYNYLRDAKVEDRNMALYAEAAVYSDNVDMIDREEILEKIREVLDELPEKCREVCLLRFVHGYKYSEISEQLGKNENTVLENPGKNTVKFISEESSLKSDIGFDSLDMAELTVRIEAEYDIDIFGEGVVSTIGEIMEKLK